MYNITNKLQMPNKKKGGDFCKFISGAGKQNLYFYYSQIVEFLGLLVLVNMTAFILTICLESPMIALERVLLSCIRGIKERNQYTVSSQL